MYILHYYYLCRLFLRFNMQREREEKIYIKNSLDLFLFTVLYHFLSAVCAIRRELIIYMVAEMIWLYNIFNLQKNFRSQHHLKTQKSLSLKIFLSLYIITDGCQKTIYQAFSLGKKIICLSRYFIHGCDCTFNKFIYFYQITQIRPIEEVINALDKRR